MTIHKLLSSWICIFSEFRVAVKSKIKLKVQELNNMLLLKLTCESTFLEKYKQLTKKYSYVFFTFLYLKFYFNMFGVCKATFIKYDEDEQWRSAHWCSAWLWEGPRLRRGGSHPVMRYVRCFSNSGWTDPWSRVTAWCPDVQRGSTLSCKRGQLGLHNKTIHVWKESCSQRERERSWPDERLVVKRLALKVGVVALKVRREGVEGP